MIRVASGGGRALDLLRDPETLALVLRTVLLVVGVVTATILVAVPFAWLVVRTDLPGRRIWATAAALPLVIPSYVAALCLLGLFGEKGLLQQALGVERLPDPTGYWGALAALTLSTYPYVFLLTQAALRDLDPGPEEAARSLGASRSRVLFRVTLPSVRPAISLGAAARRALHPVRLRRRLADAIRRPDSRASTSNTAACSIAHPLRYSPWCSSA